MIEGGGDYVFALRGNQGCMYEEARLFLNDMASETPVEVEKNAQRYSYARLSDHALGFRCVGPGKLAFPT